MKVKIIKDTDSVIFEKNINNFISNTEIEIVEIQYSSNLGINNMTTYSAIIIYMEG